MTLRWFGSCLGDRARSFSFLDRLASFREGYDAHELLTLGILDVSYVEKKTSLADDYGKKEGVPSML